MEAGIQTDHGCPKGAWGLTSEVPSGCVGVFDEGAVGPIGIPGKKGPGPHPMGVSSVCPAGTLKVFDNEEESVVMNYPLGRHMTIAELLLRGHSHNYVPPQPAGTLMVLDDEEEEVVEFLYPFHHISGEKPFYRPRRSNMPGCLTVFGEEEEVE